MKTGRLLKRNLIYYWRTNLAVLLGVATAVAVLAGALLVGDSVRTSLRNLFLQRLGAADHVVTTTGFFREQLAADIQSNTEFESVGVANIVPLIELEGSVRHESNGARAGDIRVYGVDERFWAFHGSATQATQNREVLISENLARELNSLPGESVLIQFHKPSDVPIESLYGHKEDLGRTLRLTVRDTLAPEALGEFAIRPQQFAVRAVFVPLKLLQTELDQDGRANLLLVSRSKDSRGVSDTERSAALERILKASATLEDYNLKLRILETQRSISLERSSSLLDDDLARTAQNAAASLPVRTSQVLSYVANNIRIGDRTIPYSLVTALDDAAFDELAPTGRQRIAGQSSQPAPILLNEWAANDLGAKPGDQVSLEYYVWHEDGRLETRSADFQLAAIVPISGLAADRDLVPEYPGISESPSLSDWNPPFPVDLGRIRKQDEDYWDQYRTTPKAFVPLGVGQELWQSRFGKLTSLRVAPVESSLPDTLDRFRQTLTADLSPTRMGLQTFPARRQGLEASQGATDFGEYFLYFSFFLVVSALLLTALFFRLSVEQRLRQVGLLQAVGFHPGKIRALFLAEGTLLAVLGSLLGLAGAVGYGYLMMLGLRTWWVDAVGTTMLSLHISPGSLALGGLGGVVSALACVVWTLKRMGRASTLSLLSGSVDWDVSRASTGGTSQVFRRFVVAIVFTFAGLLLLAAAAFQLVGQLAGFFGGGTLLLVALLYYQSGWLRSQRKTAIQGSGLLPILRLGFRNATYRPERSVRCIALIAFASFIIVAVDAFRRDGQTMSEDRKSGSGGFSLLAESLVPVVHDPNSPDGREALNLVGSDRAAALANASLVRFRLRPGDDASCLNLYQPTNPRILGATETFIQSNRFSFQSSLATANDERTNPWLLLNRELESGVVPVIADANSINYVLHLKLGEDFVLQRPDGPVRLRLVGALADSIFQSELVMAEKNFLRLFPEQEGYRFFLIDAPPANQLSVATALEDGLADFGLDVVSTGERLANFHRVENTYLSTFQMLGGLGLLLGTLGMAAVLLRNVLERRRELALLRAVGYNSGHFTWMVIAENLLLLCFGLLTGFACALLAIAPVFLERGGRLPNLSLGVLLFAVLISGMIASLVATRAALRSPLLPALRAE